MPGKYEYYAELAEKTAKRLTDSVESWTSFLTTAARHRRLLRRSHEKYRS